MSAGPRWLPASWQSQWAAWSARERAGVVLAAVLLVLALLWSLAVAPAWRQWQQGLGQTSELQQQWQSMQAWQAQAQALKSQTRIGPDEAQRLLQSSAAALGPMASVSFNGDMATAQFKSVSGSALAQWLATARSQAQALPVQARLNRSPGTGPVVWDGQIVLQLPPKAKP